MIGIILFATVAPVFPANWQKVLVTLLAGAILTWELYFWRQHYRREDVWRPLDVPALILFAVITLSSFHPGLNVSVLPSLTRGDGYLIWIVYILALLVAQRFSDRERGIITLALVTSGSLILLITLAQMFGLHPIPERAGFPPDYFPRASATFGNPIFLGLWCTLALAFAIALDYPIALAFVVLAAIATGSRAAWIGCIITLMLCRPRRAQVAITLASTIVGFLWFFQHQPLQYATTLGIDAWSRWDVWRETLHHLTIFGHGLNTFSIPIAGGYYADNPHNEWLYIAYSFGITGLLAYVALWIQAIRYAPFYARAGLIGYAIAAIFSWSHIGIANVLFTVIGLSVFPTTKGVPWLSNVGQPPDDSAGGGNISFGEDTLLRRQNHVPSGLNTSDLRQSLMTLATNFRERFHRISSEPGERKAMKKIESFSMPLKPSFPESTVDGILKILISILFDSTFIFWELVPADIIDHKSSERFRRV